MITPQTDKKYTVVHAFSGSGGCSSGFDEEGFETLAALDFDADACADLDYLLNRKVAVVVDIEKMEPADMRRIVGDRRPDVYVATPPCKGWSRLLGKGRRMSDKYVRMCSLAVRSVWLALHAWDEPPPLIVIENVRGMSTEGREMMDIIKRELRAFGYLFDIRTWNVGKIGNLAQSRDRCLFVARNPKRCPAFLMVPTEHPLRPCGDELGRLPPPTLDKASKSMHKLPQLSAMNWLRIAAIPPGKDWKALPPRIQLGGNPKNRHDSKFGVEDWNAPAHTVTGVGSRVPSGRSAVAHPVPVDYADPRARPGGASEPRNGNYGVEHPGQPAHTVRGEHRVWSAPASYADPMGRAATTAAPKTKRARKATAGQEVLFSAAAATTATIREPVGHGVDLQIADRDGRQSGGFGVNAWGAPAHTVVGHTDVSNTWASTATPITFTRSWSAGRRGDRGGVDPRLDCSPRNGAYGVQDPERPSATIVGHHKHDNSPGSWADNGPGFADPRLGYRDEGDEAAGKHSGRGCYGVLDTAAPAPTIRGHMEIRQAPGAVAEPMSIDPRKEWDTSDPNSWAAKGRPHAYGVQDWERPASTIRGSQKIVNSRASVAHPGYPEPTHWLVRDEAGGLVLLGPEITDWDEICYLVIMTEDEPGVWSWHRPMTDLELAVLQSLPAEHNGAMLALRGPSGKRREHIGNMLPKAVAKAIARACRATLDQPHATFQLVGKGKIWVRQKRERAPVHAEARA
jgi:site-specific DNA-cytosine methylase